MKLSKIIIMSGMLFALSLGSGIAAHAQEHPQYLHALSDLRLMRSYLDKQTPDEHMDDEANSAIREIDAAIEQIKGASIDDHKDLHNEMPVDAKLTYSDRFRKARESGDAAWHDVDQAEDNGSVKGLKHRALDHIEKANHIVDHMMKRYQHK
ncbi:hypothetical protein [Terracidiphilus sp.]|jgi:hypothetical protein|uniref:hypothetical protein n=1 Tax=Terracidiphilus sp. TaxID=1964191 RepID=UPI003C17B6AA